LIVCSEKSSKKPHFKTNTINEGGNILLTSMWKQHGCMNR